jgi:uncharacterized membrane protein YkgB
MPTKTKNSNSLTNFTDQLTLVGQSTGMLVMLAATTLGLVEVEHRAIKAVVTAQPVFGFMNESLNHEDMSTQRREREESGPHYTSYGNSQRTPGRTGKL